MSSLSDLLYAEQYLGHQGAPIIGERRVAPLVLAPPQIRTLNTVPVDALVPSGPFAIIIPLECLVIGRLGTVPYSAPIGLQIGYRDLPPLVAIEGSLWDGSFLVVNFSPNILTANGPRDALPYLGVPLQFTSPADVTGGDASYIILLTYVPYDLAALAGLA